MFQWVMWQDPQWGAARRARPRSATQTMSDDFAKKTVQDTRDTCVTRLAAADVSLDRIAAWRGWPSIRPRTSCAKTYLSRLDRRAPGTADKLRA